MTLQNRLQQDMQAAIRERDELRRDTLRMVIAAAYNAQKHAGRDLSDDEVVTVLSREVKTRRESVEVFAAAGRTEAADKEQAEIGIISAYLPEQIDPDELARIVARSVEESGATSPREMGKVMAVLMPKVKGRADGKQVSALVAQELTKRDLAGHGH
ncbi:MAG TPA: GatB/YqeY domain-containing protein [Candidatus Limnocylindria bacterium]|nr:GatB/YqeY domain-containing protein [Candidatus Limnocylindria bacterium]